MGRYREFDKDEMLERAMKIFWRHGYSAISINEVCRKMDLNPGSVYGTFGNKRGLFIAAFQKYFDDITTPGIAMIESNPSGLEGIRCYFESVIEGIVNGCRQWGCLGTNSFMELAEKDSDVAKVMLNHLNRLEDAFHNALERDGIQNARERAKYLICMSQGLNVIAKTSPGRDALNAIMNSTFSALGDPASRGAARNVA